MRYHRNLRLHIRGYEFLHRDSAGDLCLVSYHPRGSSTWHWSVTLSRRNVPTRSQKATKRTGQWHDFYRLPFGYCLIIGQQDWHVPRAIRASLPTSEAQDGN